MQPPGYVVAMAASLGYNHEALSIKKTLKRTGHLKGV